jgi:hypothetical protein
MSPQEFQRLTLWRTNISITRETLFSHLEVGHAKKLYESLKKIARIFVAAAWRLIPLHGDCDELPSLLASDSVSKR